MAGVVLFRYSYSLRNVAALNFAASNTLLNNQSLKLQKDVFRGKHWNPKFKALRAKKVIKIPLPDFDEMRRSENLSPEEMRAKLKEKGIAPPRRWTEKPIYISCSGDLFDAYVPPEGDGKITIISKPGVKQKYEVFEKKSKSYMALRKIRNFEYDFDVPKMAEKAQQVYKDAHEALAKFDEDKLHELVTEKCYLEMVENVKYKTLVWKFIQSLESPRVVHIRVNEVMAKDNFFAQATVRFHTQQTLTVYDRFGYVMHGGEDKVKDVLEYVVFEKHLNNDYGQWRIHGKIIPDWMPPRDNILKTFLKPNLTVDESSVSENSKSTEETKNIDSETPQPAIAAA